MRLKENMHRSHHFLRAILKIVFTRLSPVTDNFNDDHD